MPTAKARTKAKATAKVKAKATAKVKAKATAAAAPPPFRGFARQGMQFWHELAAEMNREWFLENKDRYQTEWVEPMTSLLANVGRDLAPVYKPLTLGAPKIMRIHRDVRFAKDKTPYKTHIGAVITVAGKTIGEGGNAAIYVHLGLTDGAEDEFVGVGCYSFDAARLARFRKAVAGKPGAELVPLVATLRKARYRVGGHDDYKKVPKGFAPDHPRAELLKLRGLTVGFPAIPKGLPLKAGLVDWVVQHATISAPLVKWLHQHVG